MSIELNGTSGIQFNDGSDQSSAASPYVLKNRIINGAMVIDQRNAGASVSTSSATSGNFQLDRWKTFIAGAAVVTAQQSSTAPTGFINSQSYTVATEDSSIAAGDLYVIEQPIEGLNCSDLNFGSASASTMTLSFWVRSSVTGTYCGALTNSAENRAYIFTYTISSANTWEQKTVTITGDTSGTWLTTNGIGIRVRFALAAGSTFQGTANTWSASNVFATSSQTQWVSTLGATFYITGVQLEIGTTATPFERRMYGQELALCQRYYYKATTGTLFNQLAFCNIRTTTSHYAFMQLPVTMRANPSSVDYSGVGIIAAWGAGVTGLSSLTLANAAYGAGQTQVLLDAVTSGAVGTVGQVSMLLGQNNAAGYVALNAEL